MDFSIINDVVNGCPLRPDWKVHVSICRTCPFHQARYGDTIICEDISIADYCRGCLLRAFSGGNPDQ